jgi:hypothetical protein
MKMSQGNFLWSDLIQTKMSFFKNGEQVLSGGWHQWEGEDIRKGCRRVNMVEILGTHV